MNNHIHKQFLGELQDLMKRFDIDEITTRDNWTGYAECGSDLVVSIEFKNDDSYIPDIELKWIDQEEIRYAN